MRLALGRLFGYLTVMVMFAFNAVRTVLDLIGYSTAPSDAAGVPAFLQTTLAAMLSVPWWAGWGVFVLCFLWITWLSFVPAQAVVAAPQPAARPGLDLPKPRSSDNLMVAMQKAARSFRTMEEAIAEGQRPSTLPAWKAFAEHMITVQISMEKEGLTAPWLNPKDDPIGWVERNARFFNRISPMVDAGHMDEARTASKNLAAKLQDEHPGPNGRKALE